MQALVFHGPGVKASEEVARPTLDADTDAIVQVDTTTICGTDLHILKGDLPAMVDGRITLIQLLSSHQIDAQRLVTHRFGFGGFMQAYDVFARAGETGALKVILSRDS